MAASLENVWLKKGIESWLLSPLGGLYALGWWAYQGVYALRVKRAAEPHTPVVTVGNLIAGGTGKTPVSLFMAEALGSMGHSVVLSMSGYGSPRQHRASLAPEGDLNAAEWGDEPAMVRWLRPSLPLVVGRDRVEAAHLAHRLDPRCVFLMDDGFQHLRLLQHVQIVLESRGKNSFCLPAGPYREPRSTGLARAAMVLPNERFTVVQRPTTFLQVNGAPMTTPSKANALCAIARPGRFRESLDRAGLDLQTFLALPDHDPLTAGTLFERLEPDFPLVVTAKDWVKLRNHKDLADRPISVAMGECRVEPEDQFKLWLSSRIDGLVRKEGA